MRKFIDAEVRACEIPAIAARLACAIVQAAHSQDRYGLPAHRCVYQDVARKEIAEAREQLDRIERALDPIEDRPRARPTRKRARSQDRAK